MKIEEFFKEYFGADAELPYSLDALEFAEAWAKQLQIENDIWRERVKRLQEKKPWKTPTA